MAKNSNVKVFRRSHAENAVAAAPQIDQEVIDQFVKLSDVKEVPYTKPTLEQFLRERYNLEPENYSEELANNIVALNNYVEVMKVGSNSTPAQHGQQVGKLNLVYLRALRSTDVIVMFDTVLWFFSYYEGEAFHSHLPFRGIAHHAFANQDQVFFFQHITSISQMIADIQTRNKRLRDLDFHGAVRNIPDGYEKHRAGLTTFIDYYTNF